MSKIRVMDDHLANQIAAGEVVEKCVSIVKELVENSIDAKSTEIKIELKEAGLREIKIVDNGIGMDEDDALLAFQRHATSKLYTADDLFSISSLGFRGEALPSIASVSEVLLKTCSNPENKGIQIHIKGGKLLSQEACEARKGTCFQITNLFYNTPARLKHLSSLYSELANVVEYVNKMALSYPNVKFLLLNDEKELLNTDGSGNLLKVIKAIYGLDVTKKMIKIEGSNYEYQINGYISLPEVNRASRNHITTIVNGRVVRNSSLNKCINESYSSYKEDSRYPIAVLIIETDPSLIDVNIHPAKLDIKFSNFDDLKALVTNLIISALKNKLLIPKIEIKKEELPKYTNTSLDLSRDLIKEPELAYQSQLEIAINMNDNSFELEEENLQAEEKPYIEEVEETQKLPELYPIGLLLGTYIVCQNQEGIYLIDQHAMQERINYEKYSYLLSHPSANYITSLVPLVIELPTNEFLKIKENKNILDDLNIKIEEFGSNSFRVLTYPTWFTTGKEELIVKEIFEMILNKGKDFTLSKFIDNVAATVSCKASIKANTNITEEDMESLISQLRKCKNPFNCPHGRPVIIHFSIYELEKMFKRSM